MEFAPESCCQFRLKEGRKKELTMTICDRKRHRRLAAAAVAAACLSASSAASPDRAEEGVANANAAARRLRGKIDSKPTPTVATASTWSGQGVGGVPGFNDGVEHGIDGDGVGMYDFGPDDMPLYLADPRHGADGGDDEDLNNVKSPMWGPTPDLTVALPEEVEAKESPSANDGRLSASGDWATKAAAEDAAEDAALEDEKSSGARGPAGRVVGGQQARIPSFVMTLDNQNGKNFRGVCGATCVSQGCRFALTAAHCISNYKKDDLRHRMDFGYVGAFTPWSQAGGKNGGMGYDILEVANVFTHPGHVPGSASKHDIAIIEYKMPGVNPTKFPDFEPMPICDFPMETSKYTMSGQKGTVAGVGQTSYGGSKSDRLMEVDVNYMRRSTCRSIMKSRNMEVTEDMVCFGGDRNGKDACGGDSGGPVVLGGFQNGCLAGVVSWGESSALINHHFSHSVACLGANSIFANLVLSHSYPPVYHHPTATQPNRRVQVCRAGISRGVLQC